MIRHNLSSKIIALIAALLLWWFVSTEQNPVSSKLIIVPLQMRGLQKDLKIDCSVDTISVKIEGTKADVESVKQKDVSAWIDVSNITLKGDIERKELKVYTQIIGTADKYINASESPSKVTVKLESLTSKSMPVEIKYLTAPSAGFAFNNPQVEPSSVIISGRKGLVSAVKRVVLALNVVPKTGYLEEIFKLTPVDVNGSEVKGIKIQPALVKLKIQTIEVLASKEVSITPLINGELKKPYKVARITSSPSLITIQGRAAVLAQISTLETDEISINQAEKTFSKDVSVNLPRGISLSKSSNKKVKVTVYIDQEN